MPIFKDPATGDVLTVTGPNAQALEAAGWEQISPDDPPAADPTPTPSPVPAKSAPKDEWVAYAISLGVPSFEADAANKADLIARVS